MANSTFWKQYGLAIIATMVAVLIVWVLASLISPDLRVDTPFEDNEKLQWYGPSLAIIFPYGIGATLAAWLLVRYQKPRMWWYVLSVIVLVLLGLQAFVQTRSNETAIWLNIMHIVAAIIIVPVVARFLPEH